MRVVVAEPLRGVELIHGDSALLAEEQLCHRPIVYCVNGCVSGGEDIDRLVAPGAAVTSIRRTAPSSRDVGTRPPANARRGGRASSPEPGASHLHGVSSGGCACADAQTIDCRCAFVRRAAAVASVPGRGVRRLPCPFRVACTSGSPHSVASTVRLATVTLSGGRAHHPTAIPATKVKNSDGDEPSAFEALPGHSENTTRVPGLTSDASRAASQLVRRTQPCDCACPTRFGVGVPCMP